VVLRCTSVVMHRTDPAALHMGASALRVRHPCGPTRWVGPCGRAAGFRSSGSRRYCSAAASLRSSGVGVCSPA